MKIRSILATIVIVFTLTAPVALRASSTNLVAALSSSGVLSWNAVSNSIGYVVLWAPTVDGPWSAWNTLPAMIPTGTVTQVSVPFFYRVVAMDYTNTLLMHGDMLPWFSAPVDVSGHSVTAAGGAQAVTNAAKFGGGSLWFNGTNAFLSAPATTDWAFGAGDFTVDFWLNFSSTNLSSHLVGTHSRGIGADWVFLFLSDPGNIGFYLNDGVVAVTANWSPATNTWHHLAATRSGGTLRLFTNGVLAASTFNGAYIGNRYNLTIGAAVNNDFYFSGYLDEIRIRKGAALWTTNFTPPVASDLP